MLRVQTLLKKLNDLTEQKGEPGLIDVDLMMDYTRVIYADLAEMRSRLVFTGALPVEMQSQPAPPPQPVVADIKPEPAPQPEPVMLQKEPETVPSQPVAAPTPPQAKKPSIQNIIGINDTYLFISELFDNDKEAYDQAIATLENFEHIELAEQWLHDNYLWNADEEIVVSFMTLLHSYYKDR